MDIKKIKKLIELLHDSDITELQLEKEGEKIKLKREKYLPFVESMPVPQLTAVQTPAVSAPDLKEVQEDSSGGANSVTISSPIVGIFHRAPSPESPPFVEAGSVVKKGQVLCIVEAMKLMNEIESDATGTISKIFIENGHPVEYGEPLFKIEPA